MSANDGLHDSSRALDPPSVRQALRTLVQRFREDPRSTPAPLSSLIDPPGTSSAPHIYSHGADDAPFLSILLLTDDVIETMVRDVLVSLDAQSVTDFEVIVVADGAAHRGDRLTGLVAEFSSDLALRTRVISVERDAVSATHDDAVSTGVAIARGRYVAVLDATSILFAHYVATLRDLATSGSAVVRARAVAQPLRTLHWPDGDTGYEPVEGAAPASTAHFSAREHLDPSAAGSPRGSYALRRDVVEFLGAEQDEAALLVEAAVWGDVSESSDEVILLVRRFDHDLAAYTSRLLANFAAYLHKVDPELGAPVVVTAGEPDYAALGAAALGGVVGERGEGYLRRVGRRTGLHRSFSGGVATDAAGGGLVPLTLLDRWDPHAVPARPTSFRVLVIVTTYNESDIIEQLLDRLHHDGVDVHVIDNWSTDATPAILERYATNSPVTWERFPAAGDTGHFELEKLLRRVEDVAAQSGADWVIHHDADEIRQSPWPWVSLIDSLLAIEHCGYNCIDHTVLNFRPVDDSWQPGDDLATSFPWCQFGDTPADFLQIKGWKPQATHLSMAANAGHEVKFDGRRVFPYKFLLRHYSIRSQAHGERKVLRERQPRWSEEERAKGWHVHYDHIDEGTSFLWEPEGLERFETIDQRLLLARLSGVGLTHNPWPGEGEVLDT